MVKELTDKYVLAILFDIKGSLNHVCGRACCTACEREVVRGTYSFLLPTTCETYGRQTRARYEERHKGILARIHIPGPKSLEPSFRRHSRTEGRAVAYMDDLLIIISENSRAQIETAGQIVIGIIEEWCEKKKLILSAQKTEMILLKGTLNSRRPPTLKL